MNRTSLFDGVRRESDEDEIQVADVGADQHATAAGRDVLAALDIQLEVQRPKPAPRHHEDRGIYALSHGLKVLRSP